MNIPDKKKIDLLHDLKHIASAMTRLRDDTHADLTKLATALDALHKDIENNGGG